MSATADWRADGSSWWVDDIIDHVGWWRHARRSRMLLTRRSRSDFGWFAIEEKAGASFLNALSNAIRAGERRMPAKIVLPTFEPTGFELSAADSAAGRDADEPYQYALFRDGLALLGDPLRGRPRDVVVWSPDGGMVLG